MASLRSFIARTPTLARGIASSTLSINRRIGRPPPIIRSVMPSKKNARGLQHMAEPSNPTPSEKMLYGVEDDPVDLELKKLRLQDQRPLSEEEEADLEEGPSSKIGRNTEAKSPSASALQATFVDNAGASSLSATALDIQPGEDSLPHKTPQFADNPLLRLHSTAPNFLALSTHGPVDLYSYSSSPLGEDSWVVLFSHPLDYSPGCIAEIVDIAKLQHEFTNLGARLLGISIGDVDGHRRWMKELDRVAENGGINKDSGRGSPHTKPDVVPEEEVMDAITPRGALDEEKELGLEDVLSTNSTSRPQSASSNTPMNPIARRLSSVLTGDEETLRANNPRAVLHFPIIADEDGHVSRMYGMVDDSSPAHTKLRNIRSSFIIDPRKKVRMITTYPSSTGRNTEEVLRALKALVDEEFRGAFSDEEVSVMSDVDAALAQEKPKSGGIRIVKPYLRKPATTAKPGKSSA
ncbi:thioredoxin-like protein [Peziza echinospora]|nr:thioredoxin-like protein [Peziza echinospora]